MRFFLSPYTDEWRGNKIAKHQVYKVLNHESEPARIVDLCTSDDIVEQVRLIGGMPVVDYDVPDDKSSGYSHRLYFPNGPPCRSSRCSNS